MMRAAFVAAALAASVVNAQQPGDITVVGHTKVSAMMMWLGTDEKVYILDKAENNAEQIAGHPAYAAVWDIATKKAEVFEVMSNPFCAAGSSLPDGSWVTFGGNNAVMPNASQNTGVQDYNGDGASPVYGTYDGRKAIRILKACDGSPASWADDCKEQRPGEMAKLRWYATSEALGDGSIIIIGGMVYGGYINRSDRWFQGGDRDPVSQFRNAENTLEFYPPRLNLGDNGVVPSQFLVDAGGLNTYSHAYLMPSGRLFLNANISNTLLDLTDMSYHPLPNDPTNTVRVYPASAGVAMLPLTPENNWTPTILFCGGTSALTDEEWGSYGGPGANVWEKRASDDCQRLTPEPSNGAAAAYEQDDAMPDPRTMGQFVILPDGTYLMVNGARMGTAGYTTQTPLIPNLADMPYYMSCATDPVMTPAIYDPSKPRGQRWITAGLKASTVARLYHSTAILLPDGAVMVAGSNPGADVTVKADNIPYPTVYDAEYWYPPYYNKARPNVTGIPQKLGYGGAYFNLTLAAGQFQNPNDAAAKTKVVLMRPGYTTHSMTMGQRYMQLNSTYNVADDGKITLSVSPPPPNANLLTPGPTVFFVVVNGVPSIGKHMIVGSGAVGTQPTTPAMPLPANVLSTKFNGVGSGNSDGSDGSSDGEGSDEGGLSVGVYAGIAAGAVAVLALIGFCFWRRRKNASEDSGAATTGAAGRNPYATRDIAPPVAASANPYGNGGAQMAQTQTSINGPVTQHHDYSAAAAATPRRSDASHSPRSPPAHDQPQVYNSQPQREYQGQGGYSGNGYDNGGYQQGDYQQGGYQQGYGQQQHGYDQQHTGGRY